MAVNKEMLAIPRDQETTTEACILIAEKLAVIKDTTLRILRLNSQNTDTMVKEIAQLLTPHLLEDEKLIFPKTRFEKDRVIGSLYLRDMNQTFDELYKLILSRSDFLRIQTARRIVNNALMECVNLKSKDGRRPAYYADQSYERQSDYARSKAGWAEYVEEQLGDDVVWFKEGAEIEM